MKILNFKFYLLALFTFSTLIFYNQAYCMTIKKTNKDIWKAIEDNDFYMVKKIVMTKGFNADQKILENWTLLHHACKKGNYKIVKLLLEKGARKSLAITDQLGQTPLFWACVNNRFQIVQLLLSDDKAIEFVNIPNNNDETPLYWACLNNRPKMVSLLLEKGAQRSVNKANSNDKTPLDVALFKKNPEIVKLLILFGANMDLAARLKAKEIPEIKKLFDITKRFDRCARLGGGSYYFDEFLIKFAEKDPVMSSFLDELKKSKRADIVKNTTDIWTAIFKDKDEAIKIINESDFDANEINCTGETLLFKVTSINYYDTQILELLLEKGAKESINKKYIGQTPLYNACFHNYFDIAKLLIKNNAFVNTFSEYLGIKCYPILWACYNNNLPLVELLLENGAKDSVNIATKDYTPIILAKINKNEKMVEILLKYGATLDETSPLLTTPKPSKWYLVGLDSKP